MPIKMNGVMIHTQPFAADEGCGQLGEGEEGGRGVSAKNTQVQPPSQVFHLEKTDLRAVQYVRFPSGPPPEY
jgi:hypothetical protein